MGPGESVSAALLLVLPLVRRAGFGASPLPLEPQPQPPGLREAVGSNKAVEPVDQEGTSGDEETSGRPGKRPSVGRYQWTSVTSFLDSVIQKKMCPGCMWELVVLGARGSVKGNHLTRAP